MRLPLNAAVLQQFALRPEASAAEIVEALAPVYGRDRSLRVAYVEQALLTAMMNGLLEESRVAEDGGGVCAWYRATSTGLDTIRTFIGVPTHA
ncbi:hypothetical protein [Xylanimonas ulmi]|uniref:Uncharacterized protein n=1 Tax=Xylanimonas ulmi TaxID=228973 RepID=A0A4Q7LXY0_9MICO|nr:hypothetical protein [Xylanibacterium ulmi]RZS59965.1 hypothetical protein EV386_0205 [Xylanibacterium ulmi]